MKRILLFLLLSAISLFAEEKPWPGVEYTEIRAYAWPLSNNTTDKVIKDDMSLMPGVLNQAGAVLTPKQTESLLAAVNRKTRQSKLTLCYQPHNAFVFYKDRKPVAFVEVCFMCCGTRTNPDTASAIDLMALANIYSEHKLPLGRYKTPEEFTEDWKKFSK